MKDKRSSSAFRNDISKINSRAVGQKRSRVDQDSFLKITITSLCVVTWTIQGSPRDTIERGHNV